MNKNLNIKIFTGIVKRRTAILILFTALFTICLLIQNLVNVNYDVNDYLPKGSHSTVSIDVMRDQFGSGIPNTRVMIRDVSIPEALEYKEKLKQIQGVLEVTWLDDAVDITVPLAMQNPSTNAAYYKDGIALFSLTVDEQQCITAVEQIEQLIGSSNSLTGNAVSLAAATTKTVSEVPLISVITIVYVILVLLLTTTSYTEPILVLMGLGMAVVINSGSNLIFGEISFITHSSGSILQLGVSLDYSVFLIHRFEESRKLYTDAKAAMVDALCKSTTSIFSSGLTTVIGFLALVLMQFRIGPDLGLALAKGIAISLITVFVYMPALILSAYKLMDKTKHLPFLPSFQKFGKIVQRITPVMVCIFSLIIVPSYLASNANSFYYGASEIFGEETKIGADAAAIEEIFGESDTYVLLVPKGNTAIQSSLSDDLHDLEHINGILSYVDTVGAQIPPAYLDKDTLELLEGAHYSRMVISVDVPVESEESFTLVEQVRATAQRYYPDTFYLAGAGVSTYDLMDTITQDMVKVNLLAIGAVFLVLALTMKSVILPIILVLSIETAIWLNIAVPYFANDNIFYIAYLIISSIQLGATVDYAILMTDRYKENRQYLAKHDALVQTLSDVTVSILTSGSELTVVGLMMGVISSNRLLAQLGIFIGRGAVFSLLIVLLVLPGLLMLFDQFVVKEKHAKEVTYNAA